MWHTRKRAAARECVPSSQGYEPSVFYPKQSNKPLFQNLTKQCQEMEVPFLSFLPDSQLVSDSYNLVVDALFGFSFKPPVRPEFSDVMDKLKKVKIPVVSIDIPSGGAFLLSANCLPRFHGTALISENRRLSLERR